MLHVAVRRVTNTWDIAESSIATVACHRVLVVRPIPAWHAIGDELEEKESFTEKAQIAAHGMAEHIRASVTSPLVRCFAACVARSESCEMSLD